MELRELRRFVAVAEELHFGRASGRLGVAQSPLSRAIRRLEKDMGIVLFKRSTRRTELTAAGVIMLEAARGVLAAADRVEARMRRFAQGVEGDLRVGVTEGLLCQHLSAVIRQLKLSAPEVTLQLHELPLEEQVARLQDTNLDIGLTYVFVDWSGLISERLGQHALWVALSREHPLSLKDRLVLSEVSSQPLVCSRSLGTVGAKVVVKRLFGAEARVVDPAATLSNLLAQVSSSLAVGLLTEPEAAAIGDPGVVFRPFINKRNFLSLYMLRRCEAATGTLKQFIDLAKVEFSGATPRTPSQLSEIRDRIPRTPSACAEPVRPRPQTP